MKFGIQFGGLCFSALSSAATPPAQSRESACQQVKSQHLTIRAASCYHCRMFNFGKPKTAGDWIVHIAGAIVAIFLIWWMLRVYVL